jgi:mono/diheme cytochrome c family protein
MRRVSHALVVSTLLSASFWAATSAHANDAAIGREIYHDMCASCHGKDLVLAQSGLAADLRQFPKTQWERFLEAVMNGKGKGMPAWKSQLSSDDVKAIWDYVKASDAAK